MHSALSQACWMCGALSKNRLHGLNIKQESRFIHSVNISWASTMFYIFLKILDYIDVPKDNSVLSSFVYFPNTPVSAASWIIKRYIMMKKENKTSCTAQGPHLKERPLCMVIPPEWDSLDFRKSSCFAINPSKETFDIFPWIFYLWLNWSLGFFVYS